MPIRSQMRHEIDCCGVRMGHILIAWFVILFYALAIAEAVGGVMLACLCVWMKLSKNGLLFLLTIGLAGAVMSTGIGLLMRYNAVGSVIWQQAVPLGQIAWGVLGLFTAGGAAMLCIFMGRLFRQATDTS